MDATFAGQGPEERDHSRSGFHTRRELALHRSAG